MIIYKTINKINEKFYIGYDTKGVIKTRGHKLCRSCTMYGKKFTSEHRENIIRQGDLI
jgi:hypothetical protein